VEQVLRYVTTDVINQPLLGADCLDGLHLIHLTDNSVQKLVWHGPMCGTTRSSHKRFFLFGDGASQQIYDLMSASTDQQVKPSDVWTKLSG